MREDKSHLIEIHVAGITFKDDNIIILKRSPERKFYPDLWECGGGQVNPGEGFKEAVKRQLREEANVIVNVIAPVGFYKIDASCLEQKKIPGLYCVCEFIDYFNKLLFTNISLSKEHVEGKWEKVDNLDKYEFIPGMKEEIKKAYEIYKSFKK